MIYPNLIKKKPTSKKVGVSKIIKYEIIKKALKAY